MVEYFSKSIMKNTWHDNPPADGGKKKNIGFFRKSWEFLELVSGNGTGGV